MFTGEDTWVVTDRRDRVPRSRGEACLVTIYGPDLGRKIALDRESTTIGRGPSCDVSVSLGDISRRHCVISVRGDRLFLRDLDSTNGTYLNEDPVDPSREEPLRSGDHINLGGVIFKVLEGGNVESLYHEELYRTAIIDGLTQIPNRRYLTEFMDRELARASRHRRPLALLLLDVDHFKRVNDEYGHVAGDQVLRDLVELVRGTVRTEACFARYGGEEFAIVLPECDGESARIVAERVRGTVDVHEFRVDGREVPVTVSVGVALFSETMSDPVQLFHEADERLYEAKHAGRNRVVAVADSKPGVDSDLPALGS